MNITDRDRARAMWLLERDTPRCAFCSNNAVYMHSDSISPIYPCCAGCSDALGVGLALGGANTILTWGDVGMGFFSVSQLSKWSKKGHKMFSAEKENCD